MKEIMKGTHAQQKRISNPQNSTLKSSQHSTLNTQHSTLNSQILSTLNTQHSTLNTQHSNPLNTHTSTKMSSTEMSVSLKMEGKLKNGVEGVFTQLLKEVVMGLGEKYSFDGPAELASMGVMEGGVTKKIKKNKKMEKPGVLFPWTGEVKEEWCLGIRAAHELFSQCVNPRGEDGFCSTCSKKKNSVADRDTWLAANGKKAKRYANVMEKKGWGREEVEREAERFGVKIPESEFDYEIKGRGRPRKTAATSDTETSSSSENEEGCGADLFAKLYDASTDSETSKSVATEELFGESSEEESPTMTNVAKEAANAEKLAAKAEKLAAKEALKAEKLAAKEAAKAEQEALKAQKLAAKEALKAEKLAAKEAKEAAKAEQEALKAQKLAEKEALKAQKLAAKEAASIQKKQREAEREVRRVEMAAKKAAKEAKKGSAAPAPAAAAAAPAPATAPATAPKVFEDADAADAVPVQTPAPKVFEDADADEDADAAEISEAAYDKEETAKVVPMTINGVEYLRDSSGTVYDKETWEELGVWDEASGEIKEYTDDELCDDSD